MANVQEEHQMAKIDYPHTIKDCNEAQDKLVMLRNKLENRKARPSIIEFCHL